MRRSSPMLVARRTPSPSSSSISSATASGATLSQSRSLPASIHPQQLGTSEESAANGSIAPAPAPPHSSEARVFRRAVSVPDRIMPAVAGVPDSMDIDEESVRNAILSRMQAEENGRSARRLRYDKLSRSEDQVVRRSGEAMAFSMRNGSAKKQRGDAVRERNGGNGGGNVEVPCEQTVEGNVLRQPVPVAVKVEPVEPESDPIQLKASPVQKNSRQFKQKATELFASLPSSFSFGGRASSVNGSPSFHSRPPGRDQSSHKEDWMQLVMNVILWRDFSTSSLIFGAGAFAILSASLMQDIHLNIVTTLSYLALTYLSAVFFRINILRRAPSSSSDSWKISEAAALELTRGALPAFNAVLFKFSQLFSGDPGTTLKVAATLWCVAHVGYWMSLWNIFRLAFFGAFLVPKFYVSYTAQLHEKGIHLVSHFSSGWESCPHKKMVAGVAAVLIWKFLSTSSRFWIAFFSLVAFKQYQNYRSEVPCEAIKKEH
ncbi:reticulon-like protein B21 [Selaginella moellendorffii]|uniref:reticulon-like protein B21 n=1 Tax=Selaginella moellendorffii TaxID=88036 RepID=UPI000D1CF748|nr:reticulon-like protein B21 [Selaginella moellendorffii]|eukprot:XP_024524526.1 reticulon-like protein B21 [Selaginella moellendorffii]